MPYLLSKRRTTLQHTLWHVCCDASATRTQSRCWTGFHSAPAASLHTCHERPSPPMPFSVAQQMFPKKESAACPCDASSSSSPFFLFCLLCHRSCFLLGFVCVRVHFSLCCCCLCFGLKRPCFSQSLSLTHSDCRLPSPCRRHELWQEEIIVQVWHPQCLTHCSYQVLVKLCWGGGGLFVFVLGEGERRKSAEG